MATDETGIVKATDADLSSSPEYRKLLADCQGICELGRCFELLHHWALGERIARELPESHEDRYGAQIILALEHDLVRDRGTLWREVQLYRTYTKQALSPHGENAYLLTWSKMKMLLALPDDLQKRIVQQILAGNLRTDDDTRSEIQEMRRKLGFLPPEVLPRAQFQLDLGIDPRKALQAIWRQADPLKRFALGITLACKAELGDMPRTDALAALQRGEQMIRDLRRRLEGQGGPDE